MQTMYKCDCGHYHSAEDSKIVIVKFRVGKNCELPKFENYDVEQIEPKGNANANIPTVPMSDFQLHGDTTSPQIRPVYTERIETQPAKKREWWEETPSTNAPTVPNVTESSKTVNVDLNDNYTVKLLHGDAREKFLQEQAKIYGNKFNKKIADESNPTIITRKI